MGIVADVRRSFRLARMTAFPCPACRAMVPREAVVFHSRRGYCPHCGGIILAPPGQPTGLVGPPPPPQPTTPPGPFAVWASFVPMAVAGSLGLYLLWMLPGILDAAAIDHLGWRAIGWESTALTIVALLISGFIFLLAFGRAILVMKDVPGLAATAATLALAVAPFVALHAFVVMPWTASASHADNWPAGISIVEFSVCADRFRLSSDRLSGAGPVVIEVQNTSADAIESATFTVKTARPSGWLVQDGLYRYEVGRLAPGARARVEARHQLGSLMWRGAAQYGGPGVAGAELMWDEVVSANGAAVARTARPDRASLWPVPDCAGARRPRPDWYIEPYRGPGQ